MIFLLRQHLNDEQRVEWPNDTELAAWLDRAANFLSDLLIADRDPTMTAEFVVRADGSPLPEDFTAFVGNEPVSVTGRVAKPLAGDDRWTRYWARLARFSRLPSAEESPYTPAQESLIVDIARMFALNKNEYDISQDMTLLSATRSASAAARGVDSNAQASQ
jgi:hypothetical protein